MYKRMSGVVAAVCGWNWRQRGEPKEPGRDSVSSLGLLPPPAAERLQDVENEHQWWPCAEKCCFSFVHSTEGDPQTVEPAPCTQSSPPAHNKVKTPHLLLLKLGPEELPGDGRAGSRNLECFLLYVLSDTHAHTLLWHRWHCLVWPWREYRKPLSLNPNLWRWRVKRCVKSSVP